MKYRVELAATAKDEIRRQAHRLRDEASPATAVYARIAHASLNPDPPDPPLVSIGLYKRIMIRYFIAKRGK